VDKVIENPSLPAVAGTLRSKDREAAENNAPAEKKPADQKPAKQSHTSAPEETRQTEQLHPPPPLSQLTPVVASRLSAVAHPSRRVGMAAIRGSLPSLSL